MLDFIQYYDEIAFHHINGIWRNSFSDALLPFMRKANNWIPLYLCLIAYLYYYFKKDFIKLFCLIALTVALSDSISSHLFKKIVQRTRPCREISLKYKAINPITCSNGYSFPSSHATNHNALATILSLTIFKRKKIIQGLFFTWAALICYAQVYVGVHYPFDILCGTLLGCFIAVLFFRFFSKYFPIH